MTLGALLAWGWMSCAGWDVLCFGDVLYFGDALCSHAGALVVCPNSNERRRKEERFGSDCPVGSVRWVGRMGLFSHLCDRALI